MNVPTDGPESGPAPGLTALMAGPPASLIDRRAERPADEEKRRGPDGETDTARAERAAALDRAASSDLVADVACSHGKFRRAAG